MLMNPTIEKLQALKLHAMAAAVEEQRGASQYAALSFVSARLRPRKSGQSS